MKHFKCMEFAVLPTPESSSLFFRSKPPRVDSSAPNSVSLIPLLSLSLSFSQSSTPHTGPPLSHTHSTLKSYGSLPLEPLPCTYSCFLIVSRIEGRETLNENKTLDSFQAHIITSPFLIEE